MSEPSSDNNYPATDPERESDNSRSISPATAMIHQLPTDRASSPKRHSIEPRELLATKHEIAPKLVIFMCGLPARGKSYVSRKLKRFLNWIGFQSEVFNVGHRRRKSQRSPLKSLAKMSLAMSDSTSQAVADTTPTTSHSHQFFDPNNEEAKNRRDKWAREVLTDLVEWLRQGGCVAIHDATNSTIERRQMLMEELGRLTHGLHIDSIFIESVCDDEKILEANIKMKTMSPDYIHMDPDAAIADFMKRMKNYEKSYEPVGESDEAQQRSFIKLVNVGSKVIASQVQGYVQSQIVLYLMNIHIQPRNIWMTAPGLTHEEGQPDNVLGPSGHLYASALAQFLVSQPPCDPGIPRDRQLEIWTSMLPSSIQMAEYFPQEFRYRHSALLDELYRGEFNDILTDERAASVFIERLRPLIIELERLPVSVVLVARDLLLGALCAYFFDIPAREAFKLRIPLHTTICLRPMPFGTEIVFYEYDERHQTFYERHGSWELLLKSNYVRVIDGIEEADAPKVAVTPIYGTSPS